MLFAPGYDEQALEALVVKPGTRILDDVERRAVEGGELDLKRVLGGLLVQEADVRTVARDAMELACGEIHEPAWADLLLAWAVAKHVTSNAIVLVKDGMTIGVGAGQMSRVDAVRLALEKAREHGHDVAGAALASDAFFPFADGPALAPKPEWRRRPAGRLEARRRGDRSSPRRRGRDGVNGPASLQALGFAPVPRDYPTILDLVGNTPIVRLVSFGAETGATLLAKLEFLNPGGSNKDRIGLAMIASAERDGLLGPGGTIVEPTSGNTGAGLAIAAAQRGYRCIFVMPDKMSQEKISMLRAYGAEVVITPTAVEADSPESYYSVSQRLAEEIPGGYKPDQYSNTANPDAHYRTTGPELWEQTDGGDVDAIVVSVGTGGSISGIGHFFKEHKPDVLIVGADPEGSVFTADEQHPVHPYLVEGIGKDVWPATMDPTVVDEWITRLRSRLLPHSPAPRP